MSTERRIVMLSVVMSASFGPLGIAFGHLLGGSSESVGRWIELTLWFLAYGLVMGLVLAYAWRVENPGHLSRRALRRRSSEYWIGDWSALLSEPETSEHGGQSPTPPRHR